MEDNTTKSAEGQGPAEHMLSLGYRGIIPICPPPGPGTFGKGKLANKKAQGKAPAYKNGNHWYGLPNWTNRSSATQDDARKWGRWGANVGCRMGGQVVGLDIDVLDPVIVAEIEKYLKAEGVDAPKRIGQAPKSLRLFRVAPGVGLTPPRSIKLRNDAGGQQGLEILGKGKQAVLVGRHPSGADYTWYDGTTSNLLGALPPEVSALPEIDEDRLHEIFEGVKAIIEGHGYKSGSDSGRMTGALRKAHNELGIEAEEESRDAVTTLWRALPNDYGWDEWVTMGHALIGALGKSDDAKVLWDEFCDKYGGDPATADDRWDSFPEQSGCSVGVGKIIWVFDERVNAGDIEVLTGDELSNARKALRDTASAKRRHLDLLNAFVLPHFDGRGLEPNGIIKAENWSRDQIENEATALWRLRELAPCRFAELRDGWEESGMVNRSAMDELLRPAGEDAARVVQQINAETVLGARLDEMWGTLDRDDDGKILKTLGNCRQALGIGAGLDQFLRLSDQSGRELWMVPDDAVLPWALGDRQPLWSLHGVSYYELTDDDALDARMWMDALPVPNWSKETVWDVLRYIAKQNRFRPVKEYLEGLVWDGTRRLERLLPDYAGTEDTERTRTIGARWMIGTANRGLNPGCKMDTSLVVVGDQGELKSTFFETLAVVTAWFLESDLGPLGQKGSMEALQDKWIVELAELSSMRRSEINATKQFLTNTHDSFRAAYARRVKTHPRMCTFCGTWNDDGTGLSNDITGARRFWTFEVGDVDIPALRRDLDQLWAEAAHRAKAGEKYWLDKKDAFDSQIWAENEAVVADMSNSTAVQDLLKRYIAEQPSVGPGGIVTWTPRPKPLTVIASNVVFWEAVGGDASRMNTAEVGRAFKALGWHRSKIKKAIGPFIRDSRVYVAPECPKTVPDGQSLRGAQDAFIERALKDGSAATGTGADDFSPLTKVESD